MTEGSVPFNRQYRIMAGKFRRYHGESWLRRLLDVKTNLLNLRDMFYAGVGMLQSVWLLGVERPDVILLKGGFVGMPVGLAAALRGIPFITHDSDAIPGLANRVVARWARYHATGAPINNYPYPKAKTRYVGVLVAQDYQYVTHDLLQTYRKELKLPADKDAQVLLVTGGSHGASSINKAMVSAAPRLLKALPHLHILHVVGYGHEGVYGDYTHARLRVYPLVDHFYRYSGAADVIVTRAGANTLAEFGIQGKACVVVPNPLLAGGHQLKNTQALADEQAVVVVDETAVLDRNDETLQNTVEQLFGQPARRKALGKKLHSLTPAGATAAIADLLIKVASRAGE